MQIKAIKNAEDHEAALTDIEDLMDLDPDIGSPGAARLELLVLLVEEHETRTVLREALRDLRDACIDADSRHELDGAIDESLLDAARDALTLTAPSYGDSHGRNEVPPLCDRCVSRIERIQVRGRKGGLYCSVHCADESDYEAGAPVETLRWLPSHPRNKEAT